MTPKLGLAVDLLLFALTLIVVLSKQQQSVCAENIAPNVENQQQVASDISLTSYHQPNAQKFRVNVSNICEKSQMRVTIRINRPFYGLIHVKDKRRKPHCFLEGTGDQTYTLDIHYTQVQTDPDYCGVVSHQSRNPAVMVAASARQSATNQTPIINSNQQTLSVILVVRLHRSIEFSDDRFFLLSCANRCQRSDCSMPTINSPDSNHLAHLTDPNVFRGIATSESIVAPTLKQTRIITESDKPLIGERCDTLLDLKFHWLVRLCWLLSATLAFMFFLSFCLYCSLQRIRKSENLRISKSQSLRSIPNQIIYSSQPTSGAENSSAWSSGTVTTEEFNDATSFLIKQQLLKNAQDIRQPVLGRMSRTSASPNPKDQAQIKRRRSIGGSTRMQTTDFAGDLPQAQHYYQMDRRWNASQRAKSQSQTIIHYNQEQDPFKAVPFQFINSNAFRPQYTDSSTAEAYSSTQDTNKQRDVSGPDQNEASRYENKASSQHFQTLSYPKVLQENIPQSQLYGSQPTWSAVQNNNPSKQNVAWQTSTRKSTFLPQHEQLSGQSSEVNQDINNHSTFNQFDPNNSRQLIDLIQHKHRHQLLQANKAAALIRLPDQKLYSEQYQGHQ